MPWAGLQCVIRILSYLISIIIFLIDIPFCKFGRCVFQTQIDTFPGHIYLVSTVIFNLVSTVAVLIVVPFCKFGRCVFQTQVDSV